MSGAGNHRARAHARSPDSRGDRRLSPEEFHAAHAGITGDTLVRFGGGERLAPCACVTVHPSDNERNVTRSSSRTAFESILSLASGRFCRRAPLALAREGRGRSSLLRFLLLGLLGLAGAALFTFCHGLSPFRVGWVFSRSSTCRADDRSRPSRGQSACAGVDRPQPNFGRRGPADSVLSRPPRAKSRQERPRADL